MSAQHAVASSRGHRSIWIGSPAGNGPLPASWPTPCQTEATIASGPSSAPASRQASRIASRTCSARERSAIELEPVAAGAGRAEHLGRARHARVGGELRPADPGQLGLGLGSAAGLDLGVADGQLDPIARQPPGKAKRELEVDDRPAHPHLPGGAGAELDRDLVAAHAAVEQLVEAELVVSQQLCIRAGGGEPRGLERGGEDVRAPPDLAVQERVEDRDRDLVAQRGAALGVSVQQQVGTGVLWHDRQSSGPSCTCDRLRERRTDHMD